MGYDKGDEDGYDKGYDKGYLDGQADVPNMLNLVSAVRFPSCNVFGKSTVELNLGESIETLQNFIYVTKENNKNNILEHLTINCLGLPINMSAFMGCTSATRDNVLKKLTLNINTQNSTNFASAFVYLTALEEIDGTPLDLSSALSVGSMFNVCSSLKEARFKAITIKKSIGFPQSPNLSATSIQSIIDGLATVTTAQTITFNKTIVLTDEQKATISDKGWTLAQ